MRLWFDTEFIADTRTIELLSIGVVREDGATYYAETFLAQEVADDQWPTATDTDTRAWLTANVVPFLQGGLTVKSRETIAAELIDFAGRRPEWWAYYADYDWVAICQLFGRMIDLPKGWPMYCRDVKQVADEWAVNVSSLPNAAEHHALSDAQWCKQAWDLVEKKKSGLDAVVTAAREVAEGSNPAPLGKWMNAGGQKVVAFKSEALHRLVVAFEEFDSDGLAIEQVCIDGADA